MATAQNPSAMVGALHWAYDRATAGLPGLGDAEDVARRHLAKSGGSAERAIDDVIARHMRYAGAAGFFTNLGGILTLPVTVPANLASVLLIQLRMIAAIAILRGYKADDPRVRTLAFLCLLGGAAADLLEEVSVGLGVRLSSRLIARLSAGTLARINHAIGSRLLARAGGAGLIRLGRIVPLIGGLAGGSFDALVTRGMATAAKFSFPAIEPDAEDAVVRFDAPAAREEAAALTG